MFVDLALISAGEQPLDIYRVQGLKLLLYNCYMISDGLKVFVDLTLISAGEQPLDIDRVQGLKAFNI